MGGIRSSTRVRSTKSASVILFISPNFPSVSSQPERSAQSDFKPDLSVDENQNQPDSRDGPGPS